MLLVYYAGHGLIGPNGELFLALPETRSDPDLVSWTALPFHLVRSALAGTTCRARNRILILDCCFSGLAIDHMSEVTSAVSGQIEVAGTCTLASSPANRPSSVQPGAQYTAYTGEILHLLRHGSADLPELLTLTAIHEHLVRALSRRGLAVPVQRNTETIGQLALARNRLWTSHGGHAHADTRPGGSAAHVPPAADTDESAPTGTITKIRSTAAGLGKRPVQLAVAAAIVSTALLSFLLASALQPSADTSASTAGKQPTGVAADPATRTAHVTHPRIHVAASIPVGKSPFAVAVDPATHTAYITNYLGNTVSAINTATNTVTATIGVGKYPYGMGIDLATHTAYITNGGSNSVSVINTATNTVTATIGVGHEPVGAALDPATHTAYITNFGGNTVSVINTATNTVTATIGVGTLPFGVAVDPATHIVYVTNAGGSSVSVIDTATNTVTRTITATSPADEQAPSSVAIDAAARTADVTDSSAGSVSVINTITDTIIATIPVGKHPAGVTVDPATHTSYVTGEYDGCVSVINTATNTVTATIIGVGAGPTSVTVDPATHAAYVTNYVGNTVSVLNTG